MHKADHLPFFGTLPHQVIHIPTFEAQYSSMKELVEQHRISEIDPAWLSLYFMVSVAFIVHERTVY